MSTSMVAHRQWVSRPADESFFDFDDLLPRLREERDKSFPNAVPVNQFRIVAVGNDLCLESPSGNHPQLSNWAIDQICEVIRQNDGKLPNELLRDLEPEFAASLLNNRISKYLHVKSSITDAPTQSNRLALGWQASQNFQAPSMTAVVRDCGDDGLMVRSIHPSTTRGLPVADVVEGVARIANNGGWMVPPARPRSDKDRTRIATPDECIPGLDGFAMALRPGDTRGACSLFHGDRNTFLTLVNPSRVIDGGHSFLRVVCFDLNDTGYGANEAYACLCDAVCGNLIFWGVHKEFRVRGVHRGRSLDKFDDGLAKMMDNYMAMPALESEFIPLARQEVIAYMKEHKKVHVNNKEDMQAALYKPGVLSKTTIGHAWDIADREQDKSMAAPNTVWGAVYGLTRHSQSLPYANARRAVDDAASEILSRVKVPTAVSASVPTVIEGPDLITVADAPKRGRKAKVS